MNKEKTMSIRIFSAITKTVTSSLNNVHVVLDTVNVQVSAWNQRIRSSINEELAADILQDTRDNQEAIVDAYNELKKVSQKENYQEAMSAAKAIIEQFEKETK